MKYIGIDLHGTLLNKQEKIDEKFLEPLQRSLARLRRKAKLYVCTGNDLPFVQKVIPPPLFSLFDGFILEAGCVVSDGKKELVKTRERIQKLSGELRRDLEKENYREVTEFRRRLTTVALFCDNPKEFAEEVTKFIENSTYKKDFAVTYSSVAVDAVPIGWNKFRGMQLVAGKNNIIAIADSMNDFDFLLNADVSFTTSNASCELIEKLHKRGRKLVNIKSAKRELKRGIIQSNFPEVEGVVEILGFLYVHFNLRHYIIKTTLQS